MGKNQTPKSAARGMKIKIKLKSKKAKVFWKFLLPFCFVFFFGSFSIFAQTSTDFLIFAEKLRNGSTEEKRDILFQVRNLRTEQASRLAVPALNDSAEIVRATAVSSVIFLPTNEAAQLLVPLLNDKSNYVRRETAYALGKLGNSQAVSSLLQILQNEREEEVKNAAAIAIGEIGDVSAVETLTRILQRKPKSDEEFTRRSAARSIGQIAENVAESANVPVFLTANRILISILQNPKESADTKREAAFALGEIGDQSSIQILQNQLNSEDIYLAGISRTALKKIEN